MGEVLMRMTRQELKTGWVLEVGGKGEEGDESDAWFGTGTMGSWLC